jgi:hypothetical protein
MNNFFIKLIHYETKKIKITSVALKKPHLL